MSLRGVGYCPPLVALHLFGHGYSVHERTAEKVESAESAEIEGGSR